MKKPILVHVSETEAVVKWESASETSEISVSGPAKKDRFGVRGTFLLKGVFLFEHHLKGLKPGSKYTYSVFAAGSRFPDTFSFRTLRQFYSEDDSLNYFVISDTQERGEVFRDIVKKNIISNMERFQDGTWNVQGILVAGDLVFNGEKRSEYLDTFFSPASDLLPVIPFFAVAGNHEKNAPLFFKYFSPSGLGISQEGGRWFHLRHGNSVFFGMNTNKGYRYHRQLEWLENLLKKFCENRDISFYFGFFHHPFQSELWVDGNTEYSGDIIRLLSGYTSRCGKGGAVFFGHSHGYSRGQQKNHPLYLVNVGSAGGHLDYWNKYSQKDYPEFQKSYDESGVVKLEVKQGEKPEFTITRFSYGDDYFPGQNKIQDKFRFHAINQAPKTPEILKIHSHVPRYYLVKISEYFDPDRDSLLESHLQIARDKDFKKIERDLWLRVENIFKDKDTMEGIDISEFLIHKLPYSNDPFYARSRYRDSNLSWSDFSKVISFHNRKK